jgi:hypothetical protein
MLASLQTQTDRAQQQLLIIKRFEALNSKAKDPKKPVGEQLSMAELEEFGILKQRLATLMLYDNIESNHLRDVEVIKKLFDVANALYISGREPNESDPQHKLLAAMRLMEQIPDMKAKKVFTEPRLSNKCSLENAIHEVELESVKRFSNMSLRNDVNTLLEIKRRAPKDASGNIDRAHMRYEDREVVARLERKLAPVFREQQFVVDLENIKGLAHMARLKYELQQKDAIDSGGDLNAVGQSMNRMKLDLRSKTFLVLLKKIAEDVPSEWFENMETITKNTNGQHSNAKAKQGRPH